MKTEELLKISNIVKDILEIDELARRDDCYLMLKVLERTHPEEVGKRFSEVMLNAKRNKINFESIRRCRQKVQEKNPELKDEETAAKRNVEQAEYINFANENHIPNIGGNL